MEKRHSLSIIENLAGFDEALREIGLINASVARADVDRRNDIITAEGRFAARTKVLTERRALLAGQMELYYRANRAELEKKRKSIELRFGRAGIKVSAPSLRTLKGWTWGKVLAALKGTEFIRTKEEVDKTVLKSAKLTGAELAEYGMKIYQPENFWFETKPEAAQEKVA